MITAQNEYQILPHTFDETETEQTILRSRRRWIVFMYASGTFGILSFLFGLGLSAAPLFVPLPQLAAAVHAAPFLLAASFPLLVFAAHSLDKIAEADKKVKLEYLKRAGCGGLLGK